MLETKNNLTRRTVVVGGTACAAMAAVLGTAVAQDKIPPEAVMYVPKTANPQQFCANCIHWQGTPAAAYTELDEANPEMAACAVVSGNLASTGWSGVWAPRA